MTLGRAIPRLPSAAKSAMRFYKHVYHRTFPLLPIPAILPYGGTVLAWDDYNGDALFSGDDLEEAYLFVQRYLKPGMTVVDVGAHQGFYTILASKMVGRRGRVLAFEPSCRERRRLRLNLHLNDCSNVTVEELAIGRHDGASKLYVVSGYNTGCNSLKPPDVGEELSEQSVEVTSLDSYLGRRGEGPVHLLKIDAEGGELDILHGARFLLSKIPRPIVVCEVMDVRTQTWGYPSQEIVSFLSSLSYRWYKVSLQGSLEWSGPARLDTFLGSQAS